MERERQTAIDGLVQFGLPMGEAKTYVGLLELGASEATPLAKKANVPQPKIYGYLANLESKGLVQKQERTDKPNMPMIYTPVSYEVVIDMLKEESNTKFKETEQVLSLIQERQAKVEMGEYISFAQGDQAVKTQLREAIRKIKSNAILLNSDFYNSLIDDLLKDRPNIEVRRPIIDINRNIENYPSFIQQLVSLPMIQTIKQNRPMVIFRDVDFKSKSCDAVLILGHPHDPSDLTQEPIIIEITHSIITKFQVGIVIAIVDFLDSLKSSFDK